MSQLRGGSVHELACFGFGVDRAQSRREVKAARRKRKADLLRAQKVADALLDRGARWQTSTMKTSLWRAAHAVYMNEVLLQFAVEGTYGKSFAVRDARPSS